MGIERIDYDLCNNCGICVDACPMDVIRIDENTQRPIIKYPEECMLCLFCERDCPVNAIYVSPQKMIGPMLAWG